MSTPRGGEPPAASPGGASTAATGRGGTRQVLPRHRVHRGRRRAPGVDPRVDTLLGMLMALTSEVAVLRDRLDAHERLAEKSTPPTPTNVDDYVPDEHVQRERATRRQRLIDKVCRPMVAAQAAADEPATKTQNKEKNT